MQKDTKHTNSPRQPDQHTPDILTTKQAAAYLGLATSTLNKWRVYGNGPIFVKLGRAVRYRKEDLDNFLTKRSKRSTSETPA